MADLTPQAFAKHSSKSKLVEKSASQKYASPILRDRPSGGCAPSPEAIHRAEAIKTEWGDLFEKMDVFPAVTAERGMEMLRQGVSE